MCSTKVQRGKDLPHLICPGPGKSGTTLLHFILQHCPGFVGPTGGKELGYFLSKQTKTYESCFEPGDSATVYFEFCPTYMATKTRAGIAQIARRIKASAPKAKILFAIRHPLYRAVSHYVHLMQEFSRFGIEGYSPAHRNLAMPYPLTFEQTVATNPVVGSVLAEMVEVYFEEFEPQQCAFFFLEHDVKNFGSFYKRLRRLFLLAPDSAWEERSIPRVLEGSSMPQYFYGGESGCVLQLPDRSVKLPAYCLYIACDRGHELLKGVDPFTARGLLGAQEYWTTDFDADLMLRVYQQHICENLTRFLALIRDHEDFGRCPDYLSWRIEGRKIKRAQPSYKFLSDQLS